jgi:hypothetical protein
MQNVAERLRVNPRKFVYAILVFSTAIFFYQLLLKPILFANAETLPPVTVRFENDSANIDYLGTWGRNPSTSHSGGSHEVSRTNGSTASFSFMGSQITLIAATANNRGIANIYIDNNLDKSIDLYSNTYLYKQSVYTKSWPTVGTHTIKVEVTNSRNTASSDCYTCIDAFDVASPADSEAPTVTATPAGGVYGAIQSVELVSSEPAAKYFTTDGSTPTVSSPQYFGIPIGISVTTTLKFIAIDEAGNVSQIYQEDYAIDRIKPETNLIVDGAIGQNNFYTSDVTVTLSSTDTGGAIVVRTEYSLDGSNWSTYTDSLNITEDGTTSVSYRSVDSVGNVEDTKNRTIVIDKTIPVATINSPNDSGFIRGNCEIIGTAADANLDIARVEYGQGQNPENWTTISLRTQSINNDILAALDTTTLAGDYTIRLVVCDKAGNTSSKELHVVIDNQLPTLSIIVPENQAVLDGAVAVTCIATDTSGIRDMELLV